MVSRARSLLDQYRSQGAKTLLEKARSAAAQLLTPPPAPARRGTAGTGPTPIRTGLTAGDTDGTERQEALADMCANIALRDLNLVDSLLGQLEQMESAENDPDALSQLYSLDHMVTRLRRNAENLRVLAGQEAGGAAEDTSSLLDVIRAALSSIEQYTRVEVGRVAALAVVGFAADDIGRLLAELLDNATAQSPPTTSVSVSAHLTERGSVLLRLEDAGIGLPPERLREINDRLSSAPVLDGSSIEHMGLAVVRRLAHKHGVEVWLGRRAPHGTTASVLLPPDLVREAAAVKFSRRSTATAENTAVATDSTDSGPVDLGPATVSGLPRRRTRTGSGLATVARPHVAAATTVSGLPRRIPQSLRGQEPTDDPTSDAPASGRHHITDADRDATPEQDRSAGREQFVFDLGAFAEGEQAARAEHTPDPADTPDEGSLHDQVQDPDPVERIHLKGTIGDD